VKEQIKQQLTMKGTVARKEALARELQKKHKVEFLLQQPTVDINVADAPMQLGSEKAKVTIVEFSDFQCPYCKEGSETMKAVMKKHKSKVKYYFKNYPLELSTIEHARWRTLLCCAS
jgi:protein-disulfide isomerase